MVKMGRYKIFPCFLVVTGTMHASDPHFQSSTASLLNDGGAVGLFSERNTGI